MKLQSVDKANDARKQWDTAREGAIKDLLAQRAEIDAQLHEFGHEVAPKRGRKPKAQQQ